MAFAPDGAWGNDDNDDDDDDDDEEDEKEEEGEVEEVEEQEGEEEEEEEEEDKEHFFISDIFFIEIHFRELAEDKHRPCLLWSTRWPVWRF